MSSWIVIIQSRIWSSKGHNKQGIQLVTSIQVPAPPLFTLKRLIMNNRISQGVIFTDSLAVAYPLYEDALLAWADATTDPISDRRQDLLRDKIKAARDFFDWICKPVHEIIPNDVKSWQFELESHNLAPAIYGSISRILSFYARQMFKESLDFGNNIKTSCPCPISI